VIDTQPPPDSVRVHPDVVDERGLMGRTAGGLYLLAGLVVIVGLALPGAGSTHGLAAGALGSVIMIVGVASLTRLISWDRAPWWLHKLSAIVLMPVCAGVLWATGGAVSYALPLLMLPLFFIAYFYPPRWAWSLVGALVLIAASPLVYDDRSLGLAYPSLVLAVAVSCFTLTAVVVDLKRRLVAAERLQRAMALRDTLTDLANRRAFDAALQDEVERSAAAAGSHTGVPSALLFFDLDRFKEVNDVHGHQAGDRVLRAVATRCAAAVRPGDTLARIGGDEFAVVAPRAGREGAGRIKRSLEDAVASVAPAADAPALTATVSYAVMGEDGATAGELLRTVDRHLHDAKRGRRGDRPQALVS
jgi:diguanylate cyclase (GGDEF)-like protein